MQSEKAVSCEKSEKCEYCEGFAKDPGYDVCLLASLRWMKAGVPQTGLLVTCALMIAIVVKVTALVVSVVMGLMGELARWRSVPV